MRRASAILFLVLSLVAASAWAGDWGTIATISNTMGVQPNRLCVGESTRQDMGCPAYAPIANTLGLTVDGTVSATHFVGDGSGLTGIAGSNGDRITSGTTAAVIANQSGGTVGFTLGGTAGAAYLHPALGLVVSGVSTTGTISGSTGYFAYNVGIGTRPVEPFHVGSPNGTRVFFGEDKGSAHRRGLLIAASVGDEMGVSPSDADYVRLDGFNYGNGHSVNLVLNYVGSGYPNTGYVGIGTVSPTAPLTVRGEIKLGSRSLACDTDRLGSLKYASGAFYICQNTANGWQVLTTVSDTTNIVGDNLGNHTATTDINLNGHGITNSASRFTVNNTLASGVYDDTTSNAPYSQVSADSLHTNGLGVGQIWIEGSALDSNLPIYIGTGRAGGQVTQSVAIGSNLLVQNGYTDYGAEAGDKVHYYNTNYGRGIETNTLTDWSNFQFRWRTGGTSVSTGTERMLLTASGLKVTGIVTATSFEGDGSKLTGIAGDNLGNHTATSNLVMGSHAITMASGTVIDAGGGWHRTYGNTGWYNGTYGGGWYMTDSNYIRNYNAKGLTVTTSSLDAITGTSTNATGLAGYSTSSYGLFASSANKDGVYANGGSHGYGLYAVTAAAAKGGVIGYAQDGTTYGSLGYNNTYALYGNGEIYVTGNIRTPGVVTANNGITVDGHPSINSNASVVSAYYPDATHYGYFAGYNGSGDRGFYLGYGNGGTTVNFALDSATTLSFSGGTLAMNSNKITGLPTPTATTDAANKAYVDSAVTGAADNLGAGGTTTGTLYSKNGSGYGYFGTNGSDYMRFQAGTVYLMQSGAWAYYFQPGVFSPYVTNASNLGSTSKEWKNGYFAGTVAAATFSGSGASLTNLNASNLAAGTVPIARLGSGTKNTTTFLRGDNTFAVPTFTETDPQVNAVTNGKWCRGTGSQVTCDQTAPTSAAADAIGIGQTWQNVLASRAEQTAYQNTLSKPIMVSIAMDVGTDGSFQVSTNGTTWINVAKIDNAGDQVGAIIIPPSTYYKVAAHGTISMWAELR